MQSPFWNVCLKTLALIIIGRAAWWHFSYKAKVHFKAFICWKCISSTFQSFYLLKVHFVQTCANQIYLDKVDKVHLMQNKKNIAIHFIQCILQKYISLTRNLYNSKIQKKSQNEAFSPFLCFWIISSKAALCLGFLLIIDCTNIHRCHYKNRQIAWYCMILFCPLEIEAHCVNGLGWPLCEELYNMAGSFSSSSAISFHNWVAFSSKHRK